VLLQSITFQVGIERRLMSRYPLASEVVSLLMVSLSMLRRPGCDFTWYDRGAFASLK
jgi:hypothetical protein